VAVVVRETGQRDSMGYIDYVADNRETQRHI
jgi:hypothetical protein